MTAMPDLQPTLTGELLTVRGLQQEDWDGLFNAASDPEIWSGHPSSDRYQHTVFHQIFRRCTGMRPVHW